MTERLPLLLADSTSSDATTSGLKALTQPFKLRLQRMSGHSALLREYASNVVLIEPLASVAAIEEFLWPKVRRDLSLRHALRDAERPSSSGGGGAAADAGDGASASGGAGGATARAGGGSSGGGSAAAAPSATGASGGAGKLPVRGGSAGGGSSAGGGRGRR